MIFLIPLFALMQKVEQKDQGWRKGSACPAGQRTGETPTYWLFFPFIELIVLFVNTKGASIPSCLSYY